MSDTAISPPTVDQPASTKPDSLGASAVALLGAAVLLDAAIETWWSGSAVRWWAVGGAALYVAATALTWHRRIGWRDRVWILGLSLISLLAVTAWRPDGLSHGVRLLGLPTPVVLSSATIVALIIAATVLLQASAIPLLARLAGALLSTYGVVAFAVGAWQGTAFQALFAGYSLWQLAPRWLQGSMVGGLVALPLAFIISVLGGLSRRAAAWRPRQLVALVLTGAIVVSGFSNAAGAPGLGVTLALTAKSNTPSSVPPEKAAAAIPADDSVALPTLDFASRLDAEFPGRAFDLNGIAAELGGDLGKIFAFVRDQVRDEVYEGVLRGARGTLMAMAGNSFDKSLLLATLLRHENREVRFARGRLTADRAAQLVARTFDSSRPSPSLKKLNGLPDDLIARSNAMRANIENKWKRNTDTVQSALDGSGIKLNNSAPLSEEMLLLEAGDHLWVEYKEGDRWLALDPSAGRIPGEAVVTPIETFTDVPPVLHHRVTIRVKIDERANTLATRDVLVYSTTSAALHGATVILTYKIIPMSSGGWRVMPLLQIDDKMFSAMSFTETGMFRDSLGNTISRGLGQLFDSKPPQPTEPVTSLATAWLDVEFAFPSGRTETVRRELLDRIGPSARVEHRESTAPLAPIAVVNGIPLPFAGVYACSFSAGSLDPGLVAGQMSAYFSAVRAMASASALRGTKTATNTATTDQIHAVTRATLTFPTMLSATARLAQLLSERTWSRLGIGRSDSLRFYEATPRLAIASLTFAPSDDRRTISSSLTLDLRRNDVRVAARGTAGSAVVAASVARGVLDAVVEGVLIGEVTSDRGDKSVASTIDVMDNAQKTNVSVRAVNTDAAVQSLEVPDGIRARMRGMIGEGIALVVPTRPVTVAGVSRSAWWRIDLRSGETLGVMDTGLHGTDEIEYSTLVEAESPLARTVSPVELAKTQSVAEASAEQFWAEYLKIAEQIDQQTAQGWVASQGGPTVLAAKILAAQGAAWVAAGGWIYLSLATAFVAGAATALLAVEATK